MPKIGLRNIKTALSVFICVLLYFVLILFVRLFNSSWASDFKIATQLYTPFFACIATAYSISTTKTKSLAQAKLRLVASLIGGLFGLAVVSLYQLSGYDWPFQHISASGNPTSDLSGLFETGFLGGQPFSSEEVTLSFLLSFILPIFLIALSVIVVVWFCNLIRKPECCFISVLTLTAVMVSLGTNPVIYGPNRILSTIVGVLVALGVNEFKLPHYRNHKKTFVFGIDGIYSKDSQAFNGSNQYLMSQLIQDGADVVFFTTRNPASLKPMLGEVELKRPVICMSGAAAYDFKKESYVYQLNIPNDVSLEMDSIFRELNVNPFVNVVRNDLLYIYCKPFHSKAEEIYAKNRKNAPYLAFELTDNVPKEEILYYVVIDSKEKIKELEAELQKHDIMKRLTLLSYDVYERNLENTGCTYLKIYSREIEEFPYLKALKKEGKELVGFATHRHDSILIKNLDSFITTNVASLELQKQADEILKDSKHEHAIMIKKAKKIYRSKL